MKVHTMEIRSRLYNYLKEKEWPKPTRHLLINFLTDEELKTLEDEGIVTWTNPDLAFIHWKDPAKKEEEKETDKMDEILSVLKDIRDLLAKNSSLF